MGYVDKHLMMDEKLVFQTKLSWILYFRGLFWLVAGLVATKLGLDGSFGFEGGEYVGYALLVFGALRLILTYIKISTSEFAVTNKRVLIKVGVINTESTETLLDKVEGIHVEQGLIGKMFNSGSIFVKGTGGTSAPFAFIDKPFEFRNAVNSQASRKG